ncbi:DUF4179 domain-containing protein [Paenibacillus alvei]|uniref:DUF4179 domain-containing protein n=1 Tax=Paenibacillus alvei TaxID=44250 RepID=UPI00228008F4|nr:DUF4179 domain-containing protein [Paenibacillus alvei]MCY9765896.1 DUF4179 domain-containing protein [Paenibacillus alvei]
MEFRDEEIEAMFAKLPEVPIPPNLSQRIAERIENMDRRRHRTKIVQRSIGTVAAGVLLFSGSIMFVPSFAAYAKQIPGLEAAVKWLEGAGSFMGIRNAKEHGYIPVQTYRTKWGEREVSVDNLYLEDDRLFVTVTIKGEDIAEAQRSRRLYDEFEDYTATLPEFEEHRFSDGSNSTTSYHIESVDEEARKQAKAKVDGIVTWTYDIPLLPEYVEQLKREDKDRTITIRLTKIKRNDEYKNIYSESEDIQVPLGINNIKPTRVVNLERTAEQADSIVQQFALKDITISPTRMLLETRTRIQDEGKADLHPGYDWDEIVRENLILKDETGKVYPIRQSSGFRDLVNGVSRNQWEFVPSVYFENKPKRMTLELKRLYVTQARPNHTFRLRTEDKYPKKIQYQGRDITILGTEYDNKGVLHLKVQPDQAGNNPFQSTFLTYEPYYLKLQGTGSNEIWKQYDLKLDTPETRAIPMTGKQLNEKYERNITFSWVLGTIFEDKDKWGQENKKQDVYDISIMAPELDEYEISIRRYNEPVEVNQKIEFTIPPLAEEHDQVGSLTEPKHGKTVKDLDSSILERMKQAVREVAGRDIDLYGVEEYRGSTYHDVTVYSKDNKSYAALDVKRGTFDVNISMNYAELPDKIKRIVEGQTGLDEKQLAARIQDITRAKTRVDRDVHTWITGKDIDIEMEGERVLGMSYDIPMDQVSAKALESAKKASLIVRGKVTPMEYASRTYRYDSLTGIAKDDYHLEAQKHDLSMQVGYHSGRILSVHDSGILETGTDATEALFDKFSNKQVLDAAAPDVKRLFGIDLNGYSVERYNGQNWYIFRKEGSLTIEGQMNRYLKFYYIDIAGVNNINLN